MLKSMIWRAAIIGMAMTAATSANATISIGSVTPGSAVYVGPTPTYNFDPSGTALVTGGIVSNTSVGGVRAQPLGSTGNYWSVGPTDGSPGTLNLSSIGDIFNISFIWGSVDTYNTLEFLDASNFVLATFTGIQVNNPADGNQTAAATNPLVRFDLTGSDVAAFSSLRLRSTQNTFEVDNFAVNAVPEPSTWAMMLIGFGVVGSALRRRRVRVGLAQAV